MTVVGAERDSRRDGPRYGRRGAWWADATLLGVFAVLTASLALAPVRGLDLGIRDLADAHRPDLAYLIAVNVNRLGSGGPLTSACVLQAAVIGVRRRSWWPLAPVVAAFIVTGAVIGPLKVLFDRAAPHATVRADVAVRLFGEQAGVSYPSGHAVNSIVWYAVMALLLSPWLTRTARIWLRVAPPVLVTAAGTYLGFHWFTDMLAGLTLGVPLAHMITRIPWPLPKPSPGIDDSL